jgi:hypothetical protein
MATAMDWAMVMARDWAMAADQFAKQRDEDAAGRDSRQ